MKAASYVTVPGILVPALFLSVNVVPVTVELFTASLNVAVTDELTTTPVAPASGAFVVTVGEIVSGAVVNDHLVGLGVKPLPAISFIPFDRLAV